MKGIIAICCFALIVVLLHQFQAFMWQWRFKGGSYDMRFGRLGHLKNYHVNGKHSSDR
jgi:hypothetical protein